MSLAKSHPQSILARAALLGRTYSIEATRTTCARIGPAHLLNRASSEKRLRHGRGLSSEFDPFHRCARCSGMPEARDRPEGPELSSGSIALDCLIGSRGHRAKMKMSAPDTTGAAAQNNMPMGISTNELISIADRKGPFGPVLSITPSIKPSIKAPTMRRSFSAI